MDLGNTGDLARNRKLRGQPVVFSDLFGLADQHHGEISQDGEKLDFYAYHPYVSSSALDGEGYRVHRTATDQRQESAYKGSDLLMASASGVSAGTSTVHLQFSHMLSKMEIELKAGEGLTLEELTEAAITIKGVKTSGKVHLSSKAY